MSVQPNKMMEVDVSGAIYKNDTEMNSAKVDSRVDGLGNLLFHMHSVHLKPILFAKEETSLQFYEHVVIATTISQLWCFPKKVKSRVIPRFKIVDSYFTLGPRRLSWLFWLLLVLSICFIVFGAIAGGCKCETFSSSYSSYSYKQCNSGACAFMVIGIVLLLLPVPALLFIPCCFKLHHVYLDVKTSSKNSCWRSSYRTHDFRFKKVGFDHTTDDKAVFDEFYLIDYVFGGFSKSGEDVMDEAHLLSHFTHAKLANQIQPYHVDESIRDLVLSSNVFGTNSKLRCKKHVSSGHKDANGTRTSYFSPKTVEV